MNDESTMPAAIRSFEEALLCGEAKGYAVCATPRRFAVLPNTVSTTFAEIADENCFYVFESEDEANRRLEQIPPEDRLGWLFNVKKVSYLSIIGKNDGPKLDLYGYPFAMRGFVVASSGTVTEWRHPGKLGWRGPTVDVPIVRGEHAPSLKQRIVSWLRSLQSKKAPNQTSQSTTPTVTPPAGQEARQP